MALVCKTIRGRGGGVVVVVVVVCCCCCCCGRRCRFLLLVFVMVSLLLSLLVKFLLHLFSSVRTWYAVHSGGVRGVLTASPTHCVPLKKNTWVVDIDKTFE